MLATHVTTNTSATNDNNNNKELSNVCFNAFLNDAIMHKDLKNNDASSNTTSNAASAQTKRHSVGNSMTFSTYCSNKQHEHCEHYVGPKVPPLLDACW